ncbi:MAG: helix-turn-helix transcriptional regulator [Acidimicrobiia bacterium]
MPAHPDPPPSDEVDLNQIVAYNLREARQLRGWTQEELADRLEPYLGQRLTQAGISSMERAWDGDRRREFDAHELLIFAMVFDLPMLYFLLPPPGDRRRLQATSAQVNHLYTWLLGRHGQVEPVYERLRQVGITDPTAAEETVEKITGIPGAAKQWSYRERRKELLLAILNEHADDFDKNIEELGRIVDHLRQVGIRGFVAEHTHDEDFTYREGHPPRTVPQDPLVSRESEAARDDSSDERATPGGRP